MSILICEILDQGIVFAADRNLTVNDKYQDEGVKIIRWPHRRALLGCVGLVSVGDRSVYEWLYDFISDHSDFTDPAEVAHKLRGGLQNLFAAVNPPKLTIVEFATFGHKDGHIVPEFWHVTNAQGFDEVKGEYLPAGSSFKASEEICGHHLSGIPPAELRTKLKEWAEQHRPFWFHQGYKLGIFNTLKAAVREATRVVQTARLMQTPTTLEDWEQHAKMSVLIYGAYFEALFPPGQRYVGGGADVLSIPWPDQDSSQTA
jgi:hypothetical protein